MPTVKRLGTVILAGVLFTGAVAAGEASVERGEALFSDAALGTSGKTCAGCHPDGKGLSATASKTKWKLGGSGFGDLEDVINACVTGPLRGQALAKDSGDMQSLVMYLKSLAGKTQEKQE